MWIDAENGSVYTPRMEGGMPRVNIYDISRHAGVSIATVSRVLNNSPHVSEETRRKVMKVIDGCGYVPNAFARGLGLNTMKTIGLLCPDAADPYLARALACLEHAFRQKHYDCLLSCTNRDLAARRQGVELLTSRHVDGMVLMGSTFIEENSEDNAYIRQAATNVPVVLLNGSFQCPNVFCVLCDDERAMKEAMNQLLDSGCKRVLYLYHSSNNSGQRKLAGCRDALAAHGRRLSEEETAALLLQANGSIGRALALSDPRTLAPILRNRERCEALLACLADRRADGIMTAIYGWDTKRDAVCDILADLHLAVRDLVLLKRTEDIRTVFFTDRDAAADLADRFTSRALIRLYDAVWKARGALESNGNVRLTLTRMAQEISHA